MGKPHNSRRQRKSDGIISISRRVFIELFNQQGACNLRANIGQTRMTKADDVIDRLGGTRSASRKLGIPKSTIHSWRRSGIPHWRMEIVLKALAECEA